MSKRFTSTLKWSDPWFQDLSPIYKCAWFFILDNCDNAGVWIVNTKLMAFQIGNPMPWEGLRAAMEDRLVEFAPGKVWVPKFIEFQYGRLSNISKPHLKVMSLLKSHGLEEAYWKRFGGYGKGIDTLKEEDKEEDKDKDKEEEGGPGETAPGPAGFRLPARSQEAVALASQHKHAASPTQADYTRARNVAMLYPSKAGKDGRPIAFPLTAQNMLAVRIAAHREYPWEEHASLAAASPTPVDGLKWVEDMPNPVGLAKLRKAAPVTVERNRL